MAAQGSDARAVFLALALPFVLNDLFFILLDGSYALYPVDYVLRLGVLGLCLCWSKARSLAREESSGPPPLPLALLAVVLLPALCWASYTFAIAPLAAKLGARRLFRFGYIEDPWLYVFDLSLGLLLVALSEELIFRKLCFAWLHRAGFSTARIILVSACFFSLTHWAGGFASLANTLVMGALYMTAYIRLRRIWPLVLAHWLHNFIYFGPFPATF